MREYWEIASNLENHNVLFSEFWEMGEPVFTDEIQTAAVCWDKEGQRINYLFNQEFWDSLNAYQRGFVISHEILHVLFKHGNRLKSIIGDPQRMHIANIAADIIVNEFLFRKFRFQPLFLGDLYEKLITEKNVLGKENDSILTFERYYAMIMQESESEESDIGNLLGGIGSLDDHDVSFSDPGNQNSNGRGNQKQEEIPEIVIDDIIEQAVKRYDEKGAQDMKELCESQEFNDSMGQLAGTIAGNCVKTIERFNKVRKQKWITLVKDWTRRKIKESVNETWIWPNRRLTLFEDSEFFLPAEYIQEKEEKDKMNVWLFMDTSGSCVNFAQRFFKAAEFIPDDYFNVRLFCFDTRTYETNLETRKLYGFGGTRFDIIESRVQQEMKNMKTKKYPDSVWVLTDGWGNGVTPEKPERWKWFMTDYHSTSKIPKQSEIYKLSDYE